MRHPRLFLSIMENHPCKDVSIESTGKAHVLVIKLWNKPAQYIVSFPNVKPQNLW